MKYTVLPETKAFIVISTCPRLFELWLALHYQPVGRKVRYRRNFKPWKAARGRKSLSIAILRQAIKLLFTEAASGLEPHTIKAINSLAKAGMEITFGHETLFQVSAPNKNKSIGRPIKQFSQYVAFVTYRLMCLKIDSSVNLFMQNQLNSVIGKNTSHEPQRLADKYLYAKKQLYKEIENYDLEFIVKEEAHKIRRLARYIAKVK